MSKPYRITFTKAEAIAAAQRSEALLQEYRARVTYLEKYSAQIEKQLEDLKIQVTELENEPIPMLLWCPECGARHIDRGVFETKLHTTHACQKCGMCWRPAKDNTVGVQHLPGYKDPE